jgi:solute carrier family 13 (sodium-dependent dicarboxylate transporter), member 2/3/5
MEETARQHTRGELIARRIGLLLGPALFVLALIVPLPEFAFDGVVAAPTTNVRVTLGLGLWMAVWWMTEALPLAATSLLPLAVLPLSGLETARNTAPQYFSDIVALFLGGFCLALAMQKAGLHKRIALRVVRIFGAKPRRLVLGFLAGSALLSMWVSNTATTIMLIPVVLTVVQESLPEDGGSEQAVRFGAACMLAVAFGASLGGVGTTIGTPPNAYFQGFFNQHYAAEIAAGTLPEITLGRWMMIGLPIVLVLVPACWLLLTFLSPRVPKTLPEFEDQDIAERIKPEGPPRKSEWMVMAIFFTTAAAWITHAPIEIGKTVLPLTGWDGYFAFGTGRSFITDGTIAITAALLLFLLPDFREKGGRLLTWEFAGRRLPWGALLLFGGGLALAYAIDTGGLNEYLKAAFGTFAGIPVWVLVALVIVLMAGLSELASNTAAAAMVVPVLASLASAIGVDPLPLLIAGVLGASSGYALPVATPPNTIVYATGRVKIGQLVRAGALLDAVSVIVMYLAVMGLVRAVFH